MTMKQATRITQSENEKKKQNNELLNEIPRRPRTLQYISFYINKHIVE